MISRWDDLQLPPSNLPFLPIAVAAALQSFCNCPGHFNVRIPPECAAPRAWSCTGRNCSLVPCPHV